MACSCGTRVQISFDIVNWDALSSLACKLYQVDSSHWGDQTSGGYSLVRFLHLHDSHNTTLVARIPLQSEENMSNEHHSAISKRIESEVATMEYIERYTNIPVPHVVHYSAHPEGDVHSPYIIMSTVEGVTLVSVWDDMDDDKRRIILRQVIDILLELWSHRFDKKGVLFKKPGGGEGKDGWYIESASVLRASGPAGITGSRYDLVTTSYAHGADYWLAFANANLHDICNETFGSDVKAYSYAEVWFMRSLIPSLFDPSVDAHGCPLSHGDFHSQNIMITDVDTNPRITAVIDWEFSGPEFATDFAQYPLFIVDHPDWEEDNPLRKRNIQDQNTFDEIILEAERNRNPVGGLPLSRLISNSYGIYLFQQAIYFPYTYNVTYPQLFKHVFGDDDEILGDYYYAIMEKGILRKDRERFDKENKVLLEARKVLGDDVVVRGLKIAEFKSLVSKHLDTFDKEGSVQEWLAGVN
jgi:aminoglycoside phosphotransferase (APT) family kinase protein